MTRAIIFALLGSALASAQVTISGRTKASGGVSVTLTGAPTGPQVTSTGNNTLSTTGTSIYWATNQPLLSPYSCYVKYGTTIEYGNTSSATTYGIVGLTGLSSGTTYHYAVNCSNGTASVNSTDAAFTTYSSEPYNAARTVLDNDAGVYVYSGTSNETWSQMPLYVEPAGTAYNSSSSSGFPAMPAGSIKKYHGLFMFAGPPSQHGVEDSWIPYTELQAYNNQEVAAGRPSMLVTATSGGVHWPVYFTAYTNSEFTAKQQFFGADPRLVRFMVNEYARRVVEDPIYPASLVNPYFALPGLESDQGAFSYANSYSIYPTYNTAGTLTAGSTSITGVASISKFSNGQKIWATGIPTGTTISSASGNTIVISNAAVISGSETIYTETSPVSGPTWDSAYPQNSAQYLNMIQSMLYQWNQTGPETPLTVNEGTSDLTLSNSDAWLNTFGQFWGVDYEGWFNEPALQGAQNLSDVWYDFQHLQAMLANGGTFVGRLSALCTAPCSVSQSSFVSGIAAYLLVKSGNSFLDITDNSGGDGNSVAQSARVPVYDALGNPSASYCWSNFSCGSAWTAGGGSFISTNCNSAGGYQCIYARQFQGGWVFLNMTGSTQTITLPSGTWYLNNTGSPVASLSLTYQQGVFITSQEGTFADMPMFGLPTFGSIITGPISVPLTTFTSGGTIYYTTDGSTPTCSGTSGTSVTISGSGSTTINAIACASGDIPSFVKSYTYRTTSANPSIQFLQATDAASDFFPETWAAVQLSNRSSSTITVHYAVSASSGLTLNSPSSGTLTFNPYEQTKALAIQFSPNGSPTTNQTVTVTLSSPANASLGTNTTFTYTWQRDSGVSSLQQFTTMLPSAEAQLSSANPTTPYSWSGIQYSVGVYTTTSLWRILFKANLSSIPSNATILSAKISGSWESVVDNSYNGTGNTIIVSAYPMNMDWTTAGGGTNGSQATWNNSGGVSSNYAATPTGVNNMFGDFGFGQSTFLTGGYLDVTSDVSAMVAGTMANNGWVLVGPETAALGNAMNCTSSGGATSSGSSLCLDHFEWYSANYTDYNGCQMASPIMSLMVTYTVPNP